MCCRGCLLAMHWAIISWLAPIFISVLLSPAGFELCRTLVVHPGWTMSWDCLVFSSPLRCSLVLLLRGVLSWYSVVLLLRGAVSCAPSWCCKEVLGLKLHSLLVAGSLSVVSPLGKEFGFQSAHFCRWRQGLITLVPGRSFARSPQVRVCKIQFLKCKN